MASKKLQWHQAFYAGVQIEFAEESDKLIFENEHHLGTMNTLISEYEKHKKETFYKSIMDIIVHANQKSFKEVTVVCKALEDLYWEVHGERIQREQKEALDKAVAEAVAEAVASKDAYIKQLETQLGMTTA